MSATDTVGARAISALEAGDRAAAEEYLGEVGGGADDGRTADLLRALLGMTGPESTPSVLEGARVTSESTVDSGPNPVVDTLQALVAGGRAIREGRIADAKHQVDRAAGMVPPDSLYLRLRVASLYQAVFRFTGLLELHQRGLAVALPIADRVEKPAMAILARSILSTMHHVSGDLHASHGVALAAIDLSRASSLARHRHVSLAHQFKGYALFEWNRLEEAEESLLTAWELAGEGGRGVRSGVARMLVSVAHAKGKKGVAEEWFERLEEIVSEPMTLRNREWLAAVRVRHDTATERDLRTIEAWRQRYEYYASGLAELEEEERPSRLGEFEHLMTVLEASGRWAELHEIAELVTGSGPSVRRWFAVRGLSAQAVALESTGRRDGADEVFRAALESGRSGGFVRAYLDGASVRRTLLRRALNNPEVSEVAAYVLEMAGNGEAFPVPHVTEKQMVVLRLVAEGKTNREVAQAIGRSESTVRTHLRAIFVALGVRTRTHAVTEARRVGLVD